MRSDTRTRKWFGAYSICLIVCIADQSLMAESMLDSIQVPQITSLYITGDKTYEPNGYFGSRPVTNLISLSVALTNFDGNCQSICSALDKMEMVNNAIKQMTATLAIRDNTGLLMKGLESYLRDCEKLANSQNGFVSVVSEIDVDYAKVVSVPSSWPYQFPTFGLCFGSELESALVKQTGKHDAYGKPLTVFHDYIAGTDPTDKGDQFMAKVEFDSVGKPVITYAPNRSDRKYTIYGKVRLQDPDWTVVNNNSENYNFFKVTVEMK